MSETLENYSEVLKYQSFGGWLRFYQLINVVGIIVLAGIGVFTAYSFYIHDFTRQNHIDFLSLFIESLPGLITSILVVKNVTKKEESIPTLMNTILAFYAFSAVVVYLILYLAFSNGLITDKPSSFLSPVIYFLIWRAYFKKSKRVATYYGKNAI